MDLEGQIKQDNTHQEIQFPKKLNALGSNKKPHSGTFLFAVNIKSGKAELVKMKATSLPMKEIPRNKMNIVRQIELVNTKIHHQVIVDETKWYVWAINAKNAERKFKRMINKLKYANPS